MVNTVSGRSLKLSVRNIEAICTSLSVSGVLLTERNRFWGDLTKSVKEVQKVLDTLSSISSNFRESAMRLSELKSIANEHHLRLLNIPKVLS